MDGKKGGVPRKVRRYHLDYRPLIDRDLTDGAIDFMNRQAKAEKPFFVYLPYTATHFPTMPNPDFVGKSGNGPEALGAGETSLTVETATHGSAGI